MVDRISNYNYLAGVILRDYLLIDYIMEGDYAFMVEVVVTLFKHIVRQGQIVEQLRYENGISLVLFQGVLPILCQICQVRGNILKNCICYGVSMVLELVYEIKRKADVVIICIEEPVMVKDVSVVDFSIAYHIIGGIMRIVVIFMAH